MLSKGIVIDGRVIPNTDRVIRDSDAWWDPGRESRSRGSSAIDMVIGHWTAGHVRTGPDSGIRLFRAMEARRNRLGADLSVSVHFGISWDGLIWQYADLRTGCVHVGARPIIRRSIGVECMWPGTAKQARRLDAQGHFEVRQIDGRKVEIMRPSDELLGAWRWLCAALTGDEAQQCGLDIPRRILGLRSTLRDLELGPGGIGEHATLPRGPSAKIDACGVLIEAVDLVSHREHPRES